MGKSFLITVNKSHLERRDLKLQIESSLGLNVKNSLVIVDTSELPALVWEVSHTGLKHGDGGKLSGRVSDLSGDLVVFDLLGNDVVGIPLLFISIPDSQLDRVLLFVHVNCLG